MNRPLCKCGKNLAKNYINKKTGKQYFRKKCHQCLRQENEKEQEWKTYGYVKKNICEKCGFKSKYFDQIKVIQGTGILHNFKSVCLNCDVVIEKEHGWHTGDLTPDF